jgi:hypothetical protein
MKLAHRSTLRTALRRRCAVRRSRTYRATLLVIALALAACSKKADSPGSGSSGSSAASGSAVVEAPKTCPAGNVIKDGACVAVITPEQVQAVAAQQTRLDELATLLDKVDTAAAPVELLAAFRKLEEWKNLTAKFEKLKVIDGVVAELDNGIKTLRTFKASLGEASGRIGNLKGELDRLMKDTGAARQLAEVRTQISSQVRAALEPLASQVTDTIRNALLPLTAKLEEIEAVIELTCASMKLGGGGPEAKDLCKQAKAAFTNGLAYLADFKERPAKLFDDVTSELEKQLDQLIDAEVKKVLDTAQIKVNEALKLPPPATGSGG